MLQQAMVSKVGMIKDPTTKAPLDNMETLRGGMDLLRVGMDLLREDMGVLLSSREGMDKAMVSLLAIMGNSTSPDSKAMHSKGLPPSRGISKGGHTGCMVQMGGSTQLATKRHSSAPATTREHTILPLPPFQLLT